VLHPHNAGIPAWLDKSRPGSINNVRDNGPEAIPKAGVRGEVRPAGRMPGIAADTFSLQNPHKQLNLAGIAARFQS